MTDGKMQPFALTLDKFLDHATKWRGTSQVVTARPDWARDRIGYADLRERARCVSALLATHGIGRGDRVATMAWNTQGHMEAWYGVMGMGAMRHTLNPRLTEQSLSTQIEDRLGVVVQTSWGMTELSPTGVIAPLGDPARSAARSGRPAIGVDLMVADDQGWPLPAQRGVEGHLHVRGAAVVQRYFGEAGDLEIIGREKDLIKSGGEWINPAEIEAAVNALPEVVLSAVVGRSHAKWGERPILLVQLRSPLSDAALLAPLEGRVAGWWKPDEIVRLESMPLAATGKINKLHLRSAYGGAGGRGAT